MNQTRLSVGCLVYARRLPLSIHTREHFKRSGSERWRGRDVPSMVFGIIMPFILSISKLGIGKLQVVSVFEELLSPTLEQKQYLRLRHDQTLNYRLYCQTPCSWEHPLLQSPHPFLCKTLLNSLR